MYNIYMLHMCMYIYIYIYIYLIVCIHTYISYIIIPSQSYQAFQAFKISSQIPFPAIPTRKYLPGSVRSMRSLCPVHQGL